MNHPAVLNLGFRPFFSGAGVFALLSIGYWLHIFAQPDALLLQRMNPSQWHAHEMLYGYSLAVIAGFLLTAVKNWTSMQTPHGPPLLGLFSLWLSARLCWFMGESVLVVAALFDLAFMLLLIVSIARPIIKTKQWRQTAVLSKLVLLGGANVAFYLGAFGQLEQGAHLSIYGGLYLIIGLILTMGRRVIPMFIEGGVDYPVKLYNSRWLDISSMVLFLLFFISTLFLSQPRYASSLAAALFVITSTRLVGWYTPGIWRTPLLWGLFLAIVFIDLGFLLFALRTWLETSPYLATHAFAMGGIGTITMAMMARVSIGHTGRNLKLPPTQLNWALILILIAVVIRVLVPTVIASNYSLWVLLSGGFWLLSFTLFCWGFLPILSRPRIDQKYG